MQTNFHPHRYSIHIDRDRDGEEGEAELEKKNYFLINFVQP